MVYSTGLWQREELEVMGLNIDAADDVLDHHMGLQAEKDLAAAAAEPGARIDATNPVFESPPTTATEESFDPHHIKDFGPA